MGQTRNRVSVKIRVRVWIPVTFMAMDVVHLLVTHICVCRVILPQVVFGATRLLLCVVSEL